MSVEDWVLCCENKRLLEECIQKVSRKSLYLLLKKYQETNSIADLKRAPRRRQLGNEHFQFIDEALEADCELTSRQLHGMVVEKYPDLSGTINKARRALGWN